MRIFHGPILALGLLGPFAAAQEPKPVLTLEHAAGPAAFLEGGKHVLCRHRQKGGMVVMDAKTSAVVRAFEAPGTLRPWILALDPKEKLAAVAGMSKQGVEVWEVASGKRIATFALEDTPNNAVQALAFGPKGKLLIVGGLNEAVIVDAKSGKKKASYRAHPHPQSPDKTSFVNGIGVSSKGLVATGEDDHSIRIWKLKGCREVTKIEVSRRGTVAAFSPADPNLIVAGDMGGKLVLFNRGKAKDLEGHREGIARIAFAGKLVLSFDEGGTLKGWALPEGAKRFELRAHPTDVGTSLDVAKGQVLTAGNTEVKLWRLP